MNRYNDSVIVITIHLNTQKYSKAEKYAYKPRDFVIMIYETYNDLMNSFFSSFRRSILKESPLLLKYEGELIHLAKSLLRRTY
jgi:hypothetical protein